MRIVAGKYRGRHFQVPRTFSARPTTDFAKENLFNVLRAYVDFDDQPTALDLFAGTGSITLELASRGCRRVVCVERDPHHYAMIRKFVAQLGDEAAMPVRADVLKFLTRATGQYDIVFADPPYTMPGIQDLPDMVLDRNLLAPGGVMVLEHGKANDFADHPRLADHRQYGSVNFSIFQ